MISIQRFASLNGGCWTREQERGMRVDVTTLLEARLQRLEDLEEIRSLILDHGRFLDTGKVDDFMELFAETGAEWKGSSSCLQGTSGDQGGRGALRCQPRPHESVELPLR